LKWQSINNQGKMHDLEHIWPHTVCFSHNDVTAIIRVTYGFHVYTDEKENGDKLIYKHDTRYFSPQRYELSFQLPRYIETMINNGNVTAYRSAKGHEQLFHMTIHDYALFFTLRKSPNEENVLKLHLISAYEVETWGRSSLPRGKTYRWSFVLYSKLTGKKIT
jgi:hypothetical protein